MHSGGRGRKFWSDWRCQREEGRTPKLGYSNSLQTNLYSAFLPRFSWDPISSVKNTHHGGIFNLEFSPDGSLLIAATERKSILVFDPLNHRLINSVDQAHSDCVNYARFLDSRMFATCSDDTTIALWDVRFLKNKIRSLKGHSNWVKNIEYAADVGLLVTSGFDGSIYTWDINGYSEGDIQFQRVFYTNGLMRMRLTPDSSKMVICTTGGFLMVIHNLDFDNLAQDLQGFKPTTYHLRQLGNSTYSNGYQYNHLFTSRKNRVELISDFPEGNEAEVISSLQVHPHGWCVLSRNTSSEDHSEWTCVHDIQETGSEILTDDYKTEPPFQIIPPVSTSLCESCTEQRNNNNNNNSSNLMIGHPQNVGSSRTEGRHRRDTEFHGGGGDESTASSLPRNLRDRPVVHIQFNYGSAASASTSTSGVSSSMTTTTGSANSTSGMTSSSVSASSHGINLDHLEGWGPPGGTINNNNDEETANSDNNTQNSTENFRFGNIELRISRRRNHPTSNNNSSSNSSATMPQNMNPLIRTDSNSIARVVEGANLTSAESRRLIASTAAPEGSDLNAPLNRDDPNTFPPELIIRQTNAFVIRTGNGLGARTYLVLGSSRPSGPYTRSVQGSSSLNASMGLNSLGIGSIHGGGGEFNSLSHKIHQNVPRLTHFMEEPNVGRGFIKELCFSSDGRLVCSPYGYGVRLLGFDPNCSELSDCVPRRPARLHEIATNVSHTNYVVSTKFSPVHCLLVSGCLSGKISFHQPVF